MLRILEIYILSLILVILSIPHLCAQKNNSFNQDSINKGILESQEEQSKTLLDKDIDTVSSFAFHSSAKADYNNINKTLADTIIIDQFIDKGMEYIKSGNVDSLAIVLHDLSYFLQEGSIDDSRLYYYYVLNADYHGLKANFIKELNNLLEAKKILQPEQISELAKVNQSIAIIYYRLLDFQSCLDTYEANLGLLKKRGTELDLLYTYFGIADCNIQLDNQNYAKKVCFQAIDLSNQTGLSQSMGFIYSLLGIIYINESRIDSAQYYLDKGISISKKQNDTKELYDNYISMVKLELLKGNKSKAQTYAELAIENPIYHDPDLYNNLAQIYSSQQNFKNSNEILQKNIEYYKEINNKNFIYTMASSLLKNKYEQEKTIQIAQREQQFQKTKIQIIIIASIILLLGSLFIIYNQIVNKRKIQKINEDLINKNKNLEQFAFICSHDLKEPIRNIGSFSTLLEHKLAKENLKSNYNEYFNIINKGTQVLTRIVNSLKIYTDLNRDMVLTNSKFSLQSLINDTIASINYLVGEKKVPITFNNEIKEEEIFSSEDGIRSILANIIENAMKHNLSEELLIHINASKLNNDILITVEDNGLGIPKEYFDQIFLPFKTLNNKSLTNSSGLGLAICTRIINIMGGKIWLESETGKGSKFYVLINQ